MKIIHSALTAAAFVMLAGPALAVGHSTAKEREITRQLNLEQSRQAQANNQNQQVASASTQTQSAQEQSPPAAAPTTPVESAPIASPAGNADQSQSQTQDTQPASPAQ
jgi:hypothetical protein